MNMRTTHSTLAALGRLPAPRTDSVRPHSLTLVRHLLCARALSLYCVNRVELQADAAVLVVRPADEVDA